METQKDVKREVIGKLRKNKAIIMSEILNSEAYSEILSVALNGDYTLFVPTDLAMNFLLDSLEITQHELVLHPALMPLLRNHLYPDNLIHAETIKMVGGNSYSIKIGDVNANSQNAEGLNAYIDINGRTHQIRYIDDIPIVFATSVQRREIESISDVEPSSSEESDNDEPHQSEISRTENATATAVGIFQFVIYFIDGVLSSPTLNDLLRNPEILKQIDEKMARDREPKSSAALDDTLLNDDFYNILQIIHGGYYLSEGAADLLNIMIINLAVQILEEANIQVRYQGMKIVTIDELMAATRKILPFDLFRRASREGVKAMELEFNPIIGGRRLHAVLRGVTKVNLDWLDYDADATKNKNYFTGLLQYIIEDILDLAATNFDERLQAKGGENAIIAVDIKKVISENNDYTIIFGRYLYL